MRRFNPNIRSFVALALMSVVVSACREPRDSLVGTPRGEPSGVYTVRGRVEDVPREGHAASAFVLFHEPIDNFLNIDGTRGMNSMTMPIPIAAGVDIEGVAPGDIVEVTFAAWTTPGNLGLEARSVRKLPADTELRFGLAAPPLGGDSESQSPKTNPVPNQGPGTGSRGGR